MEEVIVLSEEQMLVEEAKELVAANENSKREFAIGDIHGAHRALRQCLDLVKFDIDKDKLIALGDYSDGWPETPYVVEELMQIKNLVALRGNHDWWTYEWMKYGIAHLGWRNQGGDKTIDSYTEFFMENPDAREIHKDFFSNLNWYYVDGNKRLFIHAGYTSDTGVAGESGTNSFIWDRTLWEDTLSMANHEQPIKTRVYSEIFIGHSTTKRWDTDEPMEAHNITNLDTGAGYDGRLTIMDVNSKEYWQSDPVKELYADTDFKGRGNYR